MRILLVEDNQQLNNSLNMSLTDAGYAVDQAFDGQEGLELAESAPYDLVILDIMLPKKDGLTVCREMRDKNLNLPVLMLTARDTVDDRVAGLDSGADDYLVKPFAVNELLARIRALLRREAPTKKGMLTAVDLTLDPATRQVERNGQAVELTSKEFALLEYFLRHPNQVISREMVETHVWNYDYAGASNVVDVYVRNLRRKIDDPYEVKLFETVRGAGYRLRKPSENGQD